MAEDSFLFNAARREWRVLAGGLLLACSALGWINGLGRLDATLYDYLLTSGDRPRPDDVVIIAIDEASLAKLGRWPWSRDIHARLLQRLAASTPKAVGVDLVFKEAEPAADGALAAALRPLPAVLPVLLEAVPGSALREQRPVPIVAAQARGFGHIAQSVDGDGIARGNFLRDGIAGDAARPASVHFSVAMLHIGEPGIASRLLPGARNPRPPVAGERYRDHEVLVPMYGRERRIARVSYIDVLEGRVPAARFDGAYVLIGATAAGLGDAYPTPITGHSALTPGVEIHANLLDALRGRRLIERASPLANLLFNVIPLFAVLVALRRLSPRRGFAVAAGTLLALPAASAALLAFGSWFAPVAGMLCVASAYPLWSWRRLDASVRYLGEEFRRLAAEPRVLPDPPRLPMRGGDVLEARMQAMTHAAERLRLLTRFVTATLESLPDAALVADRDGRVLIANRGAARLFGSGTSAGMRDRLMPALLSALRGRTEGEPAPTWEAVKALAAQAGDADQTQPAIECLGPGGRAHLARAAILTAADGSTGGWIVTFSDIGELREAERAREEVLAFLSHDMRSPQSSILALLELHELDPEDNPLDQVHKKIEQYARRTLSLSEQFLQLARAEAKAHEPALDDLGAIAEEAVDDVWVAAEQKQIAIDLRWDGEPLPVMADRPLLLRAITNLLTNAVKYSPENTRVSVTLAERIVDGRPTRVCEVADQGYGISPENLARLFERYRRFSEPGQPKAQGAGLGMAFVKTVVEKHGGRIAVRSQPGQGSTFTLILPAVETAAT